MAQKVSGDPQLEIVPAADALKDSLSDSCTSDRCSFSNQDEQFFADFSRRKHTFE